MRSVKASLEEAGGRRAPMSAAVTMLPQTHALYFGPSQCARHCFPLFEGEGRASLLAIDDVDAAMGRSGERVVEALRAIAEDDPELRGAVLCSACPTAFLGLDIGALAEGVHRETGLLVAHVEADRMQPGNIPGPMRVDVPGGDRFHVRRALLGMLEQAGSPQGRRRGVLVLSDGPLAPGCDLRDLVLLDGVGWVRSIGGLADFDELLECRGALLAISTSPTWDEAGEYLHGRFGVPFLSATAGYSLEEADGFWDDVDEALAACGSRGQREELLARRARRRSEAEKARSRALAACPRLSLDLSGAVRPFSLVRALEDGGFEVDSAEIPFERVAHREGGEQGAYERLCAERPDLVATIAAGRRPRGGGGSASPGGGATRRREPATLWGYSAVERLMRAIEAAGHEGAGSGEGFVRMQPQAAGAVARPAAADAAEPPRAPAVPGLRRGELPPPSDVNGAQSVLAQAPALAIAIDSRGSVSTFARMVDLSACEADFESVDLPELCYASGDEESFLERMAALYERCSERREAEGRRGLEFVALLGAPVSSLIGVDVKRWARRLEERVGLPVVGVETTGNASFEHGAALAREELALLGRGKREGGGGEASAREDEGGAGMTRRGKTMRKIAIYGKGGIGKSTVAQNLAAALSLSRGRDVLLVGCDPKADSTRLLCHGERRETVLEALRECGGGELDAGELVAKGFAGVRCVEAGGPEPGVGCAGRGVVAAIEALERSSSLPGGADYVLYDVLGDVVCGGFAAPIREGKADEVAIVTSGEYLSLYAANNICKGVARYAEAGGARLSGFVCNCRGVEGELALVEEFAEAVGSRVLGVIPRGGAVQRAELRRQTVMEHEPDSEMAGSYLALAAAVEEGGATTSPAPLSDAELEGLVLSRGE